MSSLLQEYQHFGATRYLPNQDHMNDDDYDDNNNNNTKEK
jgi:hypothetical protein